MRITDEQKNKIVDNPLLQDIKCPVCANTTLLLTDRFFEVREFFGGKLELGDKSTAIPVVSLVCEQCGHILFFNALKLGVVKSGKARTPAPPP